MIVVNFSFTIRALFRRKVFQNMLEREFIILQFFF